MKPLEQQAAEYVTKHCPPSMHGVGFMVYCEAYRAGREHGRMRGLFFFFLGVVMTILFSTCTKVSYGQDSVAARVTWTKTVGDTTYAQIKIKGEQLINTVCCCKPKKKGDVIMIAKKDLLFYDEKIKFK